MKKYIISLMAAALCLASCDDWMNLSPADKLTPDSYFRTETDLKMFSNSFYSSCFQTNYFRNQSDVIIESSLSDPLRGGTSREVPNSGGGWSFTLLRKINEMLANMDKCENETVRAEYTGLARFFRAYYYYLKVRRFGDYPWIDHVVGSDEEATLYAPRDSRETVMTHMIEDIDAAIASLPESSSVYRINKYTALAVKAKFCLFEGSWRKYHGNTGADGAAYAHDADYYYGLAAAAAQEIVSSGKYRLYSTGKPAEDYVNFFMSTDAIAGETILAVDYDNSIGIYHNATWYGIKSSAGRAGFTKKFINTYLMKDGTPFTSKPGYETMTFTQEVVDRDPRLSQTIRTPGYRRVGKTTTVPDGPEFENSITLYQTIKYVQPMDLGADGYEHSFSDMPIIRYAEILLILAEAKAELGTLTQTDLDNTIGLIRARVGMPGLDMATANAAPDAYLSSPSTGYRNVTGANKGVILEIRRERTIELAQEGDLRWYDLMRWKEGLCIDQDLYGMYFPGPGEYDLNGDGAAEYCLYSGTKPSTTASFVLKIGEDIILSEGTKGYVDPAKGITHKFNEERDYLYPVPINERSLNPNLTQNPGWNDGLDF